MKVYALLLTLSLMGLALYPTPVVMGVCALILIIGVLTMGTLILDTMDNTRAYDMRRTRTHRRVS